MLTTPEITAKYGQARSTGHPYLGIFVSPFPLRLAWDTKTVTSRFRAHKLILPNLEGAFQDTLAHYGAEKIHALGIDLFGGCFAFREMRNGTQPSRHSWGIAIDLHPVANQLSWRADRALFARPEYKALMDCFYAHGFLNLGKERGFDYMHFEIAK
jgi:hypothetical protein